MYSPDDSAWLQVLTTRYARRLITMRKVAEYDSGGGAQWAAQHASLDLAIDRLHESVYGSKTTDAERAQKKRPFRGKSL